MALHLDILTDMSMRPGGYYGNHLPETFEQLVEHVAHSGFGLQFPIQSAVPVRVGMLR